MRGLIQRVSQANVAVNGEVVGEINRGILLLLGVEKGDDQGKADKLLNKVLNYRIFTDPDGKMNLGVKDINGGVLVVSQFTLAADTRKGMRARLLHRRPTGRGRSNLQLLCGANAPATQSCGHRYFQRQYASVAVQRRAGDLSFGSLRCEHCRVD